MNIVPAIFQHLLECGFYCRWERGPSVFSVIVRPPHGLSTTYRCQLLEGEFVIVRAGVNLANRECALDIGAHVLDINHPNFFDHVEKVLRNPEKYLSHPMADGPV